MNYKKISKFLILVPFLGVSLAFASSDESKSYSTQNDASIANLSVFSAGYALKNAPSGLDASHNCGNAANPLFVLAIAAEKHRQAAVDNATEVSYIWNLSDFSGNYHNKISCKPAVLHRRQTSNVSTLTDDCIN